MEVIQQQIIDAHQRFQEAQWRINLENKRTDENIKWIISHSQRLHEYQDRLRDLNEASREKEEKLRLVYKTIELHGHIFKIKDGLKKAIALTSRAEERICKVFEGLEKMDEERWEVGMEQDVNNNVFEIDESSSSGKENSLESLETDCEEDTEYKNLISENLFEANTRIKTAQEKCADLEMRKQELIQEIENYKNRKKDAVRARLAIKEKLQNANLKLYFVEFGAI